MTEYGGVVGSSYRNWGGVSVVSRLSQSSHKTNRTLKEEGNHTDQLRLKYNALSDKKLRKEMFTTQPDLIPQYPNDYEEQPSKFLSSNRGSNRLWPTPSKQDVNKEKAACPVSLFHQRRLSQPVIVKNDAQFYYN